jgi:hypothetical protein
MRAAGSVALLLAALLLAGCSSPTPVKTETGIFWVPGCGDGPLVIDGASWYPADVDAVTKGSEDRITPGDGQGTFTEYSNGTARWDSMGGAFRGPLTTDPANFEKACGGSR